MPRNKYPEETVQKILDAALQIFTEKGYEQTTILDIVGSMQGLTRGAFYHHFKSKDEVLNALTDRIFFNDNPFEKVKTIKDLNGLQKLQWVFANSLTQDKDTKTLNIDMAKLLNSPAFLKKHLEQSRDILTPLVVSLIEEGIEDNSITVEYPKQFAELFVMLIQTWMLPTLYPCTEEESFVKFEMLKQICNQMGLPLFDDEFVKLCEENTIIIE